MLWASETDGSDARPARSTQGIAERASRRCRDARAHAQRLRAWGPRRDRDESATRARSPTLMRAKRMLGEVLARRSLQMEISGAEQSEQPDDDQIDCDDVVQQPRHDKNQDAGEKRNERCETQVMFIVGSWNRGSSVARDLCDSVPGHDLSLRRHVCRPQTPPMPTNPLACGKRLCDGALEDTDILSSHQRDRGDVAPAAARKAKRACASPSCGCHAGVLRTLNSSAMPGGSNRPPRSAYFKRMSFLTDFTPPTVRATSTALFSAACELTKPLS